MQFREPRDTEAIHWTRHVKDKMSFYHLSESRLKRLLRNPERVEEGVAAKTLAIMQRSRSKRKSEVWLMYQIVSGKSKNKPKKLRIISAWRYPGSSPPGKPPIPEDTLEEIKKLIENSD